jgi:cell division protein FtsL
MKLRTLSLALVVLAGIIALPLLAVWKQVYITRASIEQDMLSDSLAVLRTEAVRLRMEAGRLASVERIERIAREQLRLDYPPSDRIVIVRPEKERPVEPIVRKNDSEFMTALRKSLGRE